ncbi:MAG: TorF family putative porin [Burkholderiaceae bacterium]
MKSIIAASCAMIVVPLLIPSFAQAEDSPVTGNLSFTSDYRFRGITQTNEQPALQGGFDWAAGNGLYLGTWASNVSWVGGENSLEWDFYGGYTGKAGPVEYDVGGLYYWYPGEQLATSPNTFEVYGAVTYNLMTLKYSHALTELFGFENSEGSGYLDLSAAIPVAGYEIGLHAGYQTVQDQALDCDYVDWSVSGGGSYAGFDVTLAYVDTNADTGCWSDTGDSTVTLTVGKSF